MQYVTYKSCAPQSNYDNLKSKETIEDYMHTSARRPQGTSLVWLSNADELYGDATS